jgi:hypothetical protein
MTTRFENDHAVISQKDRFICYKRKESYTDAFGYGNGYILLKNTEMYLIDRINLYYGTSWNSTLENFNKHMLLNIQGYTHVIGFDTCHSGDNQEFGTEESIFKHLEDAFEEALNGDDGDSY